jgi:hypothetical protein
MIVRRVWANGQLLSRNRREAAQNYPEIRFLEYFFARLLLAGQAGVKLGDLTASKL